MRVTKLFMSFQIRRVILYLNQIHCIWLLQSITNSYREHHNKRFINSQDRDPSLETKNYEKRIKIEEKMISDSLKYEMHSNFQPQSSSQHTVHSCLSEQDRSDSDTQSIKDEGIWWEWTLFVDVLERELSSKSTLPKVFITSRTHAQIKQLIKELKENNYLMYQDNYELQLSSQTTTYYMISTLLISSSDIHTLNNHKQFIMCVLASRERYCINTDVRRFAKQEKISINTACRGFSALSI